MNLPERGTPAYLAALCSSGQHLVERYGFQLAQRLTQKWAYGRVRGSADRRWFQDLHAAIAEVLQDLEAEAASGIPATVEAAELEAAGR